MNLDQQIREQLAERESPDCPPGDALDWDLLATAVRAVLDLPPMKAEGFPPSPIAACMAGGYNQALADVRVEIADKLGIQPPPEGADWAAERDSGPALGAVVSHVERQVPPVHENFTVKVLGTDQHGNFRTQGRP